MAYSIPLCLYAACCVYIWTSLLSVCPGRSEAAAIESVRVILVQPLVVFVKEVQADASPISGILLLPFSITCKTMNVAFMKL
ncbi:hypothetical protein V8C26DRAFT_413770 [Trichoderma gracile]